MVLSTSSRGETTISTAFAWSSKDNAEEQRLEMLVQQRLRTEVIEFGHPPGGLGEAPRTWLGISFWSFDEESFVRITDVKGLRSLGPDRSRRSSRGGEWRPREGGDCGRGHHQGDCDDG